METARQQKEAKERPAALAAELGVPEEALMDEANSICEEKRLAVARRNQARAGARWSTGLDAADIKWLENHHYDYSIDPAKLPKKLGDKLKGYDTYARSAAAEYGDEIQGDDPLRAVWDLIREGDDRKPQPTDENILEEAAARFKPKESEPQPTNEPGANDEDPDLWPRKATGTSPGRISAGQVRRSNTPPSPPSPASTGPSPRESGHPRSGSLTA